MFRKSILSLVAFAVVATAAAFHVDQASANEPNSKEARELVEYFEEQDYFVKCFPLRGDNDSIVVKIDDKAYLIFVEPGDNWYSLNYCEFYSLDSKTEWEKAILVATKINKDHKVAKVVLPGKYIASPEDFTEKPYISIEAFYSSPQEFCRNFERCVKVVDACALKFTVNMLADSDDE